jgi:phospholipase/carboxylesterase
MDEPLLRKVPDSDIIYRLRLAQNAKMPGVIMLHGLGGDENSMWILEHALPKGGLVIAPRAPFASAGGGYSWVEGEIHNWPALNDFQPAINIIDSLLNHLQETNDLKREHLLWLGFSQGAAFALAMANHSSVSPAGVIIAAGFLPDGDLSDLDGLPIFWGHGSRDEWIPISRAQSDVQRLRGHGAEVHFCQAEVGHKMGMECLRGLDLWLRGHLAIASAE